MGNFCYFGYTYTIPKIYPFGLISNVVLILVYFCVYKRRERERERAETSAYHKTSIYNIQGIRLRKLYDSMPNWFFSDAVAAVIKLLIPIVCLFAFDSVKQNIRMFGWASNIYLNRSEIILKPKSFPVELATIYMIGKSGIVRWLSIWILNNSPKKWSSIGIAEHVGSVKNESTMLWHNR